MNHPTDKHGRECKPWNKVVVPEYKCLNCEHRGRGCQKHDYKRKGVVGVTDHDKRVYHHMYETNEGIAEHAERIAKLEELVLALRNCADESGYCDCDTCLINGAESTYEPSCGCDTLREMIQELLLVVG